MATTQSSHPVLASAIAPPASPPDALAALRDRPKVRIQVHKTGDRNEMPYITPAVNGVTYQIMRGEPVDVPDAVVDVLENAVQTLYTWDDATNSLKARKAQAYPFSRLS